MSFNSENCFQKNKYSKFLKRKIIIFPVFLFIGLSFLTIVYADWNGLPFAPGSMDNPPCLPSQINCDVVPSVTSELDPIFIASQAFTITGMDISNWNGKQSALGFTPVSNTTTVNGHSLTSDISITPSDLGLGNITNESKAMMFASPVLTGTVSVNGNINMTGSIIPSVNDTYALGSPSKVWKDLYVGAGSIYVNGQKVLQTDPSNSVLVSADVSQNLILQTTGGGNVELNPASGGGQVLLKSNIVLTAGKTIRSSDLTSVIFSDGTTSGNIQTAGNVISSSNLNGGISISPNGLGNTYVTNGNFGVGTTSGLSKVSINGGLHVGGDSDAGDNNILADGTIYGSNLSGTNTGDNATNSQYSGLIISKQDTLNGTGLVRVSSGTVTYDNTNYVSGTPWTGMGYVTGTPWASQGYVTGTPWTSMGYVTGTPWATQGYITGTPWTSAGYITDGNTGWDNSYGFITGYTETDPIFTASSAAGITGTNISNWNTAYGWGNHATAGYLTSANISGLIPYTGGTSNVDLGIHNLTVDTNSLFVDSVNHRVGVGTTSPVWPFVVGSNSTLSVDPTDGRVGIGGVLPAATANAYNLQVKGAYGIYTQSGFRVDRSDAYAMYAPNGGMYLGGNVNNYIAGNLGIGTTGPTKKLQIAGGDFGVDAGKKLYLSQYNDTTIGETTVGNIEYNSTNGGSQNHIFITASLERMRIDSSGNVGIGTTLPGYPLEVNGLIASTGIQAIGAGVNADFIVNPKGNGQIVIGGGGWSYTTASSGKGSILFNNGSQDTPNMKFAFANNRNFGIDSASNLLRFIKDSDESGGAVIGSFDLLGNFVANGTGSFGANAIINGGGNSYFNGGNVGIGISNPTAKLDVNVTSAIRGLNVTTNTDPLTDFVVINPNVSSNQRALTVYTPSGGNSDQNTGLYIQSRNAGANPLFIANSAGTGIFTVKAGGNVGIGTVAPSEKLQITNGNAAITGSYGSETLSENNFSTHAKWDTTGDINDTNGNATYSHSTGSGILTQTAANLATAGVGSSRYEFTYTVSSAIETLGVIAEITNSFASSNTALDLSEGIHTVSFISASVPGDFNISILSNSVGDGFTLDDLSLKRTIGGSLIAVSGLITGGGASGIKVTPAGDIGINTISPRAKFEVAGSSYILSSLTASKEFTISFSPNAVANQKVDLYISGTQFFWGNIDVELTGNYSNQNTSGLIKKSFGLGLNPGGAIYSNDARYSEVSGATSDNFAISNLSWDAANSRYKITIVHRVSTDNTITVRMTALSGYDTSNISNFLTFTKGPVYTTDTTVYPKPEVSYNGKVGFGVSSPTASLHLKAGTAALNTAPLKFTSGVLLSTPEVGAVEFNNDAYYGTITTGGARKQFAFTTDISTAINNYLPYTGGTSNVDLGIHNLTVDTNTLFVNSVSHNVGVGVTNPSGKLSIRGAVGSNSLEIQRANDGMAMITVDDWGQLTAGHGFIINAGGGYSGYGILDVRSSSPTHVPVSILGVSGQTGNLLNVTSNGGSWGNLFNVQANGNVGIGSAIPTSLLQVAQSTIGTGIVTTSGSVDLVGIGTQFTNTFKVGDTITVSGETIRTIATITDNTHLTSTVAFTTSASALSYSLVGGARLAVLGNGNVGIGTTTPNNILNVLNAPASTSVAFGYDGSGIYTGVHTSATSTRFSVYEGQTDTLGSPVFGFYNNEGRNLMQIGGDTNGPRMQFFLKGSASAPQLMFDGNISMASGRVIGWSATDTNAALDTGFSRGGSAGKLYIGNGMQGDYSGTLITGNIGIGTTSTTEKLTVQGNILATNGTLSLAKIWDTGTGGSIGVYDGAGNQSIQFYGNIIRNNTSTLVLQYGVTNDVSIFGDTANPIYFKQSNGNVGIGNTNPINKLDVDGIISSDLGFNITTVPAPTAATLALVSDSSVSHLGIGLYNYRITYVTAIGETGVGTLASVTTDANNRSVQISNIPISTNPKVTSRRIYRTGVNQTTDRGNLLTTIANNTATTFLDTIPDSSLSGDSWAGYKSNTTSKFISLNGVRSLVVDPNTTALGVGAGGSFTSAGLSAFVGSYAGASITYGFSNTFFGASAGRMTTTGGGNIAIGGQAMYHNTTGSENIVVGGGGLWGTTNTIYNTAIGAYALSGISTSDMQFNVAIGTSSGGKLINGYFNTFLGSYSGSGNNSYNGWSVPQITNVSYSTAVGNSAYTSASYQTAIGGQGMQQAIITGDTYIKRTTSTGGEVLNNGNLTSGTSWSNTNDCSLSSDVDACAFSAGSASTLTQTSANFSTPIKGGRWYVFKYTLTNLAGYPSAFITTGIASVSTPLYLTANGTHSIYFFSKAIPTDFIITTTLASGQAFILDSLSLKEVNGGDLLVNGNVGIGTTNPTHLLTMGTGGGFYDELTGAWIDGSDLNYKDNILSLDKYGLSTLNKLRPVSYDFKHSGVAQIGFIAQEVKLLIPELVSGEDGAMGLNYGGFSPLIVKSIQELDLKLEGIAVPVDIITNRTFAERFYDKLIAWLGSSDNGLEKICVKKADGTSFCADGDQLEKAVNGLSEGGTASVVEIKKEPVAAPVVPPAPADPVVVEAPAVPIVVVPAPIPDPVTPVVEPIAPIIPEVKSVTAEPVAPVTLVAPIEENT
jgi:hypothetical protein